MGVISDLLRGESTGYQRISSQRTSNAKHYHVGVKNCWRNERVVCDWNGIVPCDINNGKYKIYTLAHHGCLQNYLYYLLLATLWGGYGYSCISMWLQNMINICLNWCFATIHTMVYRTTLKRHLAIMRLLLLYPVNLRCMCPGMGILWRHAIDIFWWETWCALGAGLN